MTNQCSNCKYWCNDPTEITLFGIKGYEGICRIEKPDVLTTKAGHIRVAFPACNSNTWCGEWVTSS